MKTIFIVIAVVFGASMITVGSLGGMKGGFGQSGKESGLATVNGREVDRFRFNQMWNRMVSSAGGRPDPFAIVSYQAMALSDLVNFEIIEMEGEKNFGASGEEVDRAISDIMKANKISDSKAFDKALKSQGFSLDDLKRTIKEEIVYQKTISKVKPMSL